MNVVEACVFLDLDGHPRLVGRLRMNAGEPVPGSEFTYAENWLADPAAVSLDPVQLPLQPGTFRSEADWPVFNGLRDAAPDRWGRLLIDAWRPSRGHGAASEAEVLLSTDSDLRVGALRFGPSPAGPRPVVRPSLPDEELRAVDLEAVQAMADVLLDEESLVSAPPPWLASAVALGGARPKTTLLRGGMPWVVKFGQPEDRIEMARVEAACLDLCGMAGLAVPAREVIQIAGRPALLLERFDRVRASDGQGVHRRHLISSLTLLGAHESDREAHGYADLVDAYRRHGSRVGLKRIGEEIWTRMVLNVLTGNGDDHYRNHALLLGAEGYEMAPVYDVTPTLQVGATRRLFFHLGAAGSGREATLADAVAAAPAFGLEPDRARARGRELAAMVAARWEDTLRARGVGPRDLATVSSAFAEAGRGLAWLDEEEAAPAAP